MIDKQSFFSELKRRNVYKVAVAYALVAWLLIQIATQIFPFDPLRGDPRFEKLAADKP